MSGVVTIAQEGRFQLTDEEGVSHLFTLSPHMWAEPDDLEALQREQAHVRVSYKPTHNQIGYLATRLDRL